MVVVFWSKQHFYTEFIFFTFFKRVIILIKDIVSINSISFSNNIKSTLNCHDLIKTISIL